MATDHIRYDLLVQDAFRGIFRKVMNDAAAKGMPGEHHFYITFRTNAPGVKLSDRMRAQYPGDMTIILQHQFWDLIVNDTGFEVGLSFQNIPERLVVPFDAVTGFFDPSVNFGAEFTVDTPADAAPATGPALVTSTPEKPPAKATPEARPRNDLPRTKTRGSASEPDVTEGAADNVSPKAAVKGVDAPEPDQASKVVSIDAFRKKT